MSTVFEQTQLNQQAKYNDITLIVKWISKGQLNYVSIESQSKFSVRMYKNITYCDIGKTGVVSHVACPLLEPFAFYIGTIIQDEDYQSFGVLFRDIEKAFLTYWNRCDFIDTINEIVRETLFASSLTEDSDSEPATITINKSTVMVVALAVLIAIAALTVVQPF